MKRRLTISEKVFLLFITLTSLTVLLGGTVYFGLRDLQVAGSEVRVLDEFQLQIKELSAFKIGKKEVFTPPDQTHFGLEFAKAQKLLEQMRSFQSNLSPEASKQLDTVGSYLDYYRQAFVELFVKYEQDQHLNREQRRLVNGFVRDIKELAPAEQLALFENFQLMQTAFEESYYQHDLTRIAAMKGFRDMIAAITGNAKIIGIVEAYEANAEAMYLNFLGILDRENFLTDTADHFFRFATETAQVISAESRQRQMTLSWLIAAMSLLAVFLTVLFWWRSSLYFRRFLDNQKMAIRAIENAEYDYAVPDRVPNDEIGDLTLFMKELAVNLKMNIDKVRKSEQQLRQAKEEWERTFDAIGDIVTIQDADMRMIRANRAAFQAFGDGPGDIVGRHCYEVFRGAEAACCGCPIPVTRKDFKPYSAEVEHQALHKVFWVSASPVLDENGELKSIIHFAKDITEIKKLEAQFLQAQKMEAVGRLASGVAHDFNNILTSILGYSELLLLKKAADPNWRDHVEVIKHAGEKAAVLVRQLLTFSRRQQLDIQNVNVNEIIRSLHKMLIRVIREDVNLELRLDDQVSAIKADPGQVEQVIMNLAVNARDAMPDGGRLSIATANIMIDERYAMMHVDMHPGPYVMVGVEDNGQGMSREVQARIFEPFFTTKLAGKGSGLGLATVYSIVKQHNGCIDVYSEPGQGTYFKIYFPATMEAAREPDQQQPREEVRYGGETILVVDDETAIRQMIVDSLSPFGYKLLGAANGEEALRVAEQFSGSIDLLLTDIIMPGMSGTELAERMLQKRPTTRILFMSGYLDARDDVHELVDTGKNFLAKPIMPSTLMKKLREILG
ncbi:MAG: response regulator [Deltaproteobacteria bacterium]|nr:response regulator [Deltaproteobacteria bacterium]